MTNSKRKGLPVDWTKHLRTDDERKSFSDAVLHDTLVLGRLTEIIEEKLAVLQNQELSSTLYDNPSWAYKQAHMNGIKTGLTTILKLLP